MIVLTDESASRLLKIDEGFDMLEKLLQAIAITLLLSILAGIGTPKQNESQRSIFHALTIPPIFNVQPSL